MSRYILGIDAGGTKTHATLADENGEILATVGAGGANWERFGIEETHRILEDVVADLLSWASVDSVDVRSSTFALAGIDWPQDLALFNSLTQKLNFGGPTAIINDSFAALYAGAPNGIGAISIAGTGGKTTVSNGSNSLQTMGMELGEGGGGGQLISLAVEKVAQSYHQGRTGTPLAELLLTFAERKSLLDLFYDVARSGLRMNESLAPAIFNLASGGDIESVEIVSRVAHQHALDVISLCSRLPFEEPITVVQAGGLHTAGNKIFNESFDSTLELAPFTYMTQRLEISPSYGAVIHASHQLFGGSNPEFSSKLINGARKRELQ